MSRKTRLEFVEKCQYLLAELDSAVQQSRTIIYCDETLFSKKALLNREWSAKNTNLAVD